MALHIYLGMEITLVPISKLKLNEKNPRRIDKDQFEKLCESIKTTPGFFQMRPCLINKTKGGLFVYAGNQRLRAAKKLGLKQVPAIVAENIDDELLRKYIMLDNISHGEHDFEMLSSLYDPQELIEWGMTEKDLDLSYMNNSESEEKEQSCVKCDACGQKIKKKK